MDIKKVLLTNYMPYAKGTIIARAIPAIDGLKPVNRRILYRMYKLGLQNSKSKSANIVGATMKLHPHGDAAIYEAMARMTTGNASLNVPYIHSKGNFGRVYSRDIKCAASRYTEAGLADICRLVFDGIDEDAIDFIDNYDNTDKEPTILPVKFPSVLVNTSSGIAVGRSSNIPSFGLKEVCEATIGILEGKIEDVEQLMGVLGAPDFSTGGYIHGDAKDYALLGRTGRGSLTISGTVETYPDKIVITEVPYNTTIEAIVDEIKEHIKSGELKEVVDVRDETDLNGLRGVIELKRGCNARQVLKKINRLTKLRTQISFITRVVLSRDGKTSCEEIGLLQLLEEWITFRIATLQRIYTFRLNKRSNQEHLLSAWEKIKNNIAEVGSFITTHSDSVVIDHLMSKFDMDEEQANYLMDHKAREFTTDKVARKLAELEAARADMKLYKSILENDDKKVAIIISDLKEIISKYGTERRTTLAEPISPEADEDTEEEEIDDTTVSVLITKRGYVKRLVTWRDESNFALHDDDDIRWRFSCSNRDTILVFTYSGMCYKIPVYTIDASRGVPKDFIFNMVEKVDDSDIMYAAPAGDYSGYVNIVYSSGRGTKVRFSDVSGNRSKYKNVFEGSTPGNIWCTPEDKFFIITHKRRAAYIDLELVSRLSTRSAFKVARVQGNDSIYGVQPLSKVPDAKLIDLEKYSKGYCVNIKDTLW